MVPIKSKVVGRFSSLKSVLNLPAKSFDKQFALKKIWVNFFWSHVPGLLNVVKKQNKLGWQWMMSEISKFCMKIKLIWGFKRDCQVFLKKILPQDDYWYYSEMRTMYETFTNFLLTFSFFYTMVIINFFSFDDILVYFDFPYIFKFKYMYSNATWSPNMMNKA